MVCWGAYSKFSIYFACKENWRQENKCGVVSCCKETFTLNLQSHLLPSRRRHNSLLLLFDVTPPCRSLRRLRSRALHSELRQLLTRAQVQSVCEEFLRQQYLVSTRFKLEFSVSSFLEFSRYFLRRRIWHFWLWVNRWTVSVVVIMIIVLFSFHSYPTRRAVCSVLCFMGVNCGKTRSLRRETFVGKSWLLWQRALIRFKALPTFYVVINVDLLVFLSCQLFRFCCYLRHTVGKLSFR